MKIESAIEMIRQEQKSIIKLVKDGTFPRLLPFEETYYGALDMAISALEKQIPKRANNLINPRKAREPAETDRASGTRTERRTNK